MDQRLIRILGGSQYPYALESKFPRILDAIMSLWDDDEEIDRYFAGLMVSDRPDRTGFPPDVASDIMHLSLIHAARIARVTSGDVWQAPPDSFQNFAAKPGAEWTPPDDAAKSELLQHGILCTPESLFEAVEAGNRSAVALFMDAKTSTEIRDNRGWTPLMTAAFHGRDEIIELLIQYDADVNALDDGGNNALHWAAFGGHTACAKRLIRHQIQIDQQNSFGWTPLTQAALRNHPDIVKLLIDSGANLNISTDNGYTPLHQAVSSNYPEIVKLLLEGGADQALRTAEGDTPYMLAVRNKRDAMTGLLMPDQPSP